MREKLIENWNKSVKPNDTVWHLGDFGFGMTKNRNVMFNIASRINGTINFCLGNHDKLSYLQDIFPDSNIYHYMILKKPGDYNNNIVLCHYPIYAWDGKTHGSIHLYGHVHGDPIPYSGRHMDVGVDVNNYEPVSLDYIISKFENYKEVSDEEM
jgi:calcineurin-like phosphoesterase family protein